MSTALLEQYERVVRSAQRGNLAIEFGVDITSTGDFVLVAQLDRAQASEA